MPERVQAGFLLVFQYENLFRAQQSKKADVLPGKDKVYHFLSTPVMALIPKKS